MGNRAGGFHTSKYFTAGSESVRKEIHRHQRLLRESIASLPAAPPTGLQGRGIVTAGGSRHIASLWVLLSLLRFHHNTQMPVEVWHLGEVDFPAHIRRHFDHFNVTFVDASEYSEHATMPEMTGWELKPFAIAHSRFAEVIWIDADNTPVIDPATLFNDPDYQATGALFWPDIQTVNPYNPIWRICGMHPPTGWEWESGLLVIDKARHWRPLMLTFFLNTQSHFYYQYVLGDKETFHLAWKLLKQPHRLAPVPARATGGAYDDGEPASQQVVAIWQHDRHGNRVALHRTGSKWVAHGRNLRCDGFNLHDICLDALTELRGVWDGRIALENQTSVEQPDIVAGRTYSYVRLGLTERSLELREDGRIGRGTGGQETHWRLEADHDGPTLIISSRLADTYRLRQGQDGIWRGSGLCDEQVRVELVPLAREQNVLAAHTKPTLLYITPVVPSDSGNGLAMRAASVLSALVGVYRVSVLIIEKYPSGPGGHLPDWVTERCDDVRWALPPPTRNASGSGSLAPAAWIEAAARAYRHTEFDVIHVFRSATLPYVDYYLTRNIDRAVTWHIDLDDVESRLPPALVPGDAGKEQHLEEYLLSVWDRVYVCSALDRDYLQQAYPWHSAEIRVLPNSVSIPAEISDAPREVPIRLIMVGTLGYAPNADAAHWFCRDVLPAIRERTGVPFIVQLVGAGAPEDVQDLGYVPEVQYIGPVPDVAGCYRQADIAIVPLRYGGGTRIKILEALAFRRPVVSTSIGAEGLDLEHGQHLLVADRAHDFAMQCLKLIESEGLARSLAGQGHERVCDCYSRQAVSGELIRSELAARRQGSPAT